MSGPCLQVIIVDADGAQDSTVFTSDQVVGLNDRTFGEYHVRSTPGGDDRNSLTLPRPTSVRAILDNLIKVNPDAVTEVDIPRAGGGGSVVLSPATGDLKASNESGFPFRDGLSPAFYTYDGIQLGFARPLRADGDQDVNARDIFQGDDNGPLTMYVHTTGRTLRPVVKADETKVQKNTPVQFSVDFDGAGPSAGASYTWSFGDGPDQPAGASPKHAWSASGTYPVQVRIRAPDGATGISEPVTITIDTPTPPSTGPSPTPGGGGAGVDNPATGPVTSGGAAAGGTPTSASGGNGAGDSDGAGPSTSQPTAGSATTSATKTKKANGKRKPDAPVSASGEQVTGVLLSTGAAAQSVEVVEPPSTQQVSAAAARRAVRLPRDQRWLLTLVPLLLLLGGVVRQTRWSVSRIPSPPWRDSE